MVLKILDSILIYILHDEKSDYKEEPFYLIFATRYETKENSPPLIEPMNNFYKIFVDELFEQHVKAKDYDQDKIEFTDDTYLFEINTCWIAAVIVIYDDNRRYN